MNLEQQLYQLHQIGIALSSERNVNALLEKILTEARAFTNAEGASIYIKKDNVLMFVVSQNEVLAGDPARISIFANEELPLTPDSMAGYVGVTGKVVNIEDAYRIPPGSPYKFQKSFDEENHYRTMSMLLVPMKDSKGQVIGVLALINARDEGQKVVPFDSRYEPLILSLSSQAAVAYLNAQLNQKLKNAYIDTVMRLAMAAECREPDIAGHLQRISAYSAILARQLGLSEEEVEDIRCTSPMHDIGKIGIPDCVLNKPGKLTPEEYETMKKHTIYGAKILSNSSSEVLRLSESIALTHHEHYDGSGYPNGLRGEEIPLAGRIIALADVFDALASQRAYKESWQMDDVTRYIRERSSTQFDPKVVAAFEKSIEEFFEVSRRFRSSPLEVL